MLIRLAVLCLLAAVFPACDNEASLQTQNNSPSNNPTGKNNPSNNPNNGPNNVVNNTTTPGTNNPTTGPNNPGNNVEPDLYDTTPDPDNRDYVGTIPPFTGNGAVEQFVYDMTVASCQRWAECKDNINALAVAAGQGYRNVGDCVQDLLNRSPLPGFSQAVAEDRAQFFEEEVSICLIFIGSFACEEISHLLRSPRSQVQDCQSALFGLTGQDETCLSEADCTTGLVCSRIFADDCSGTCQISGPQPTLCGQPLVECGANQYCDFGSFSCTNVVPSGGACTNDEMCGPIGFCRDGNCAPRKYGYQAGQSCNFYSNICAMGLNCNPVDGLIENGECGELSGPGERCAGDTDCRYDTRCSGGTCVAKLDTGACSANSACLSNVCTSENSCVSSTAACNP